MTYSFAAYDKVIDEIIFPSFVCSCIPQIDMMSVLQEVYEIQKTHESKKVSNEGGYHSPIFDGTEFSDLREIVEAFVNDILDRKELGASVEEMQYWCNINKGNNYNVMHSHGRADLIGIYYVKVPPDSGELVVIRNDGSHYGDLYENRQDMIEWAIKPETGRLYILPGHVWHYVTNGKNTREDRISISFNLYT